MSASRQWTVTAVRYGTLPSTKGALYYRWDVYGDADGPQSLDYFFYLLRDDTGRTLLVDCGFRPDEGRRRGRTCLIEPLDALARLGVEPDDVERVIVSHLHYDHIGNLQAFEGADLVVPARELDFWTSPRAREPHFGAHVDPADVQWVADARASGRVTEITGTSAIEPGITAIEVGGHSPAQQIVLIETPSGKRILASDAIHLYEEFERRRPFAVIVDLDEMYDAYELAETLSGEHDAIVIPGHDPLVTQRFPALPGEVAQLGVTLG
jgi:glyoxylase-like metal-dependent hydrolase (beta-lactamase superfamily II)